VPRSKTARINHAEAAAGYMTLDSFLASSALPLLNLIFTRHAEHCFLNEQINEEFYQVEAVAYDWPNLSKRKRVIVI